MRIDKITLYNFGSYEGETVFETQPVGDRNIVLIGGKNGAGKTTLFTAMRLCLYGFLSMGYKNYNAYYTRAISKLVNNAAKRVSPTNAYVELRIVLNNGQGLDFYDLKRWWVITDSVSERFFVEKNGIPMESEEIADFEKYILRLIPPELFNLYFFDGERIADFFLDDGGNTRVKDAFLTLCGYDTFDIMRKNFKRVSSNVSTGREVLKEYIEAKESYENASQELKDLEISLSKCADDIDACESDIKALEKDYYSKGGITEEEWNEKLYILKDEERKREYLHSVIKKWANELIPFLMIKDQVIALKDQISKENSALKYQYFCEVLEDKDIAKMVEEKMDVIKSRAFQKYGTDKLSILKLSFEQSTNLFGQIQKILDFDIAKVEQYKEDIKDSLAATAKTRKELENSSIATVKEYMKNRANLFEQKSLLLVQYSEIEQRLQAQKEEVIRIEGCFKRAREHLEESLKKSSIDNIAAKAIVVLDKLQQNLYAKQIEKVESFFRKEVNTLIRKTRFIDDIDVDDNFNIHIYRFEEFSGENILNYLTTYSEEQLIKNLGVKAIQTLRYISNEDNLKSMVEYFKLRFSGTLNLPIEIDKSTLSNGEKQIFIMALYHSLVKLSKQMIPFVIDTPFARIDTEHRENISEYFFSKLEGQVFILSTNEEIDSKHVQLLKHKIAATYMLENVDNKRTVVEKNMYFGA